MKTKLKIQVLAGVLALGTAGASWAEPMGTAFTYQGQLKEDGVTVNDTADLEFTLWDSPVEGDRVGPAIVLLGVEVVNGLFTVELDFGTGIFAGEARWLEIAVRVPACSSEPCVLPTMLSPRQELTPAPYAVYAQDAGYVLNGITGSGTADYIAKFTDTTTIGDSVIHESEGNVGIGMTNDGIHGKLAVAGPLYGGNGGTAHGYGIMIDSTQISPACGPGGCTITEPSMVLTTFFEGNIILRTRGGEMRITDDGDVGIGTETPAERLGVAGNIHADGTITSGNSITIDGENNLIISSGDLELHVRSGRALRLEATQGGVNIIAGTANVVSEGMISSTIAGGSDSRVAENFVTIGGGCFHLANGEGVTIGGG
ncbi:MAG: hypothetical protein KAV82_00930 [Phycisphaerae bacterium]|nr:hypothetical protein [Phycisphaerae bacterium]